MTLDPTINIFNALTLFGGVQGIVFAMIMLCLVQKNRLANRYLAIILGVVGLLLLHRFLWRTGLIYECPYVVNVALLQGILIPPAIYLYTFTMTKAANKRPNWPWIITPVVAIWILQIPTHITDLETQISLISNTYMYGELPLLLKISFKAYVLTANLLFAICIILSFKLLLSHTKNVAHFFSYRESIELAWLRNSLMVTVFFLGVVAILYFFLPFFGMDTKAKTIGNIKIMFAVTDIAFVVGVFYTGVMGMLQSRIYGPSEHSETEFPVDSTQTFFGTKNPAKRKYNKSSLNYAQSVDILDQLELIMRRKKPYLQSDLTLAALAESVSTTPNILSQVINEQLQMSFFDYINSYRVELAKELLLTPSPEMNTILDVAMASAFNSKSAFYTAFKKQLGTTPIQYKKQANNFQAQSVSN